MNFMSGRGGFYEEITTGSSTTGMSSSSSSSPSSLQHKAHPLYTYHHHQEHYVGGGGGRAQLTDNNGGGRDEDSDDHMLVRRAGGGEGSTSTGTGTISHVVMEKEHMFDKVVTPSDVGKLNRLVIPKQHAEKYFPLDSSTNEKGLLLNFEDRNGKPWRFRYSYWNSSQSYVMTKGWSRFVKEKKLDAGDIVSFQRGVGELGKDRLFIDWRRRPDAPDLPPSSLSIPHHFSFQRSSIHPWNPLFLHPPPPPPPSRDYSSQMYQNNHHVYGYGGPNYGYNTSNVVNGNPCPPGSLVYLRSSGAAAGGVYTSPEMGLVHAQRGITGIHYQEQMVYESVPVVQGKAAAKRLRLFGVNMDCPISESDEQCDDHILSSTTMPLIHHMNNGLMQPPSSSSSSIPYLQLGHNYSDTSDDDKGKGSMSLDLDI